MPKTAQFRVVRSFYLDGIAQKMDAIVTLSDLRLICDLMQIGKIVPVDVGAPPVIGVRSLTTWEPARDPSAVTPWQDADASGSGLLRTFRRGSAQ